MRHCQRVVDKYNLHSQIITLVANQSLTDQIE